MTTPTRANLERRRAGHAKQQHRQEEILQTQLARLRDTMNKIEDYKLKIKLIDMELNDFVEQRVQEWEQAWQEAENEGPV